MDIVVEDDHEDDLRTWNLISAHQDMPWDWYVVSSNRFVTKDFVRRHIAKSWCWDDLFENVGIELLDDYFKAGYDPKQLNWDMLSMNLKLTWDIVERYIDQPWEWLLVSEHPNITWGVVQSHPEAPWNRRGLSLNTTNPERVVWS
jgi:hypothetical protein